MRSPGRPRRRAEPPRPAVSRRNSRRPSTSSATVRPAASLSPNTSVAEALIVPGDPSGRPTIKFKTRFSRVNPLAHNNCPNNGWVDPVTRTSHGKTERRCCSLSPSLPEPAKPTSRQGWRSAPARPGTGLQYFTAAELVETLYRALADNSVGRVIENLLRNDLILCRRDSGSLRSMTPAPNCCSGSSPPPTNDAPSASARTGRSRTGAGSSPNTPPPSACSTGCCTTATSWSPMERKPSWLDTGRGCGGWVGRWWGSVLGRAGLVGACRGRCAGGFRRASR